MMVTDKLIGTYCDTDMYVNEFGMFYYHAYDKESKTWGNKAFDDLDVMKAEIKERDDLIQLMMFETGVLDYLTFANDPTRESIHRINVRAREVPGGVDWLKENEPTYFIPDNEMEGYLEA